VDEFACEEVPEGDAPPAPDPAEQQAQRDALWHAVSRLPARQRAMLVLRYYEDLTETQTARLLGVSVGTVKSAVSRALVKLRADPGLADAVTEDFARRDPDVAGGAAGSDIPDGMPEESPVPTLA
jgi:DNA-directed RNA polymerase specialized sigma24 family protein